MESLDKGYLIFDPKIDLAVLDQAVEEIKITFNKLGNPERVQDAFVENKAIRTIALWPTVGELLEEIYKKKPFCFQTLNFQVGTQQKAHSDTIHFNSDPPKFMCGVWVALEDMDENNGPLVYYPGSNHMPEYTLHDVGGSYQVYENFLEKKIVEHNFQPEYGLIKKGMAILWTANLWHGGSTIKDPSRTRFSQASHYFFDDCIYYTPMHSPIGQKALRNPHKMYFS